MCCNGKWNSGIYWECREMRARALFIHIQVRLQSTDRTKLLTRNEMIWMYNSRYNSAGDSSSEVNWKGRKCWIFLTPLKWIWLYKQDWKNAIIFVKRKKVFPSPWGDSHTQVISVHLPNSTFKERLIKQTNKNTVPLTTCDCVVLSSFHESLWFLSGRFCCHPRRADVNKTVLWCTEKLHLKSSKQHQQVRNYVMVT